MRWGIFGVIVAAAFAGYGVSQIEATPQSAPEVATKPLVLEREDGEHRVRRPRETPMPTREFTIKVDPKNGGSRHLVVGTEIIPPGGQIARHKHLGEDEIVFIETGAAHVRIGSEERDVHAGSLLFIPSETWIALKNTGGENMGLAFVFSAPGFEQFQRCISVPAGSPAIQLTQEEFKACQHSGHIAFDLDPQPLESK
jgi:quercetin dioxygenase-like cupin family protein